MADIFGALPIPPPVPDAPPLAGDVVAAGDPFLTYALSFFRAFLNANLTALWQAGGVAPTLSVIKNTFAHDPAEHNFNGKNLPALYMWRSDFGATEWLAEDWIIQRDKITMLWVFPPSQDGTEAKRRPVANALVKAIVTAIERERDPSWVIPGDPDPNAATQGSIFATYSGHMSCDMMKGKPSKLIVRGNNVTDVYDTLEVTLEVTERQNYDLTRYAASGGLDLTVETTDAPPLVMDRAIVT